MIILLPVYNNVILRMTFLQIWWEEFVDWHIDNILSNNGTIIIQSGNTLPNNIKSSCCFISLIS